MTIETISRYRLENQQVSNPRLNAPKEVVAWMGAMQAQDYKMAKWAITSRLKEATDTLIEAAINQGEIIRTHVLRPTWHLVAAEDIYWMLELTAPKIKASLKSRHRQLAITEILLKKSNALIEKQLSKGKHLTRDEFYAAFDQAKISIEGNRGYHLLLWAELDGLICSGAIKGGKTTYALLEERVPRKDKLTEDEALNKLAKKYFSSHAPATIQDFAWWSGLSIRKAKRGFESIQSGLVSVVFEDKTYWFSGSESNLDSGVQLLPAYDEFLIGYKDKSISLPYESHRKKVHHIGVFRPFIVINGIISGVWKLIVKKKKTVVQVELFQTCSDEIVQEIRLQIKKLEYFYGCELEIEVV